MNRILPLLSFLVVLLFACGKKITMLETPVEKTVESVSESQSELKEMKLTYPSTKKGDQVDEYHGIEVADPYRWLEDDLSKETAAWVTAQNSKQPDFWLFRGNIF